MSAAAFEELYRQQADPWSYRSSAYERAKYAATLEACGTGPFESALELGGSIGVFSALLASRCRALTTIDFSATAVRIAQAELAHIPRAQPIVGEIPHAIPDGPYDLVVASEVLYYLDAPTVAATLARLGDVVYAHGRLVLVHWIPTGPERLLSALQVHQLVCHVSWLRAVADQSTSDYLLHVLERR